MTGSAAWDSIDVLVADIKAQSAFAAIPVITGTPTPVEVDQNAVHAFVAGSISEWNQSWNETPQGSPLTGNRDEAFTLYVGIYVRRMGATFSDLRTVIKPLFTAVQTALRADWTLGGVLSASGMAEPGRMSLDESLADPQTRELMLRIAVNCTASIT